MATEIERKYLVTSDAWRSIEAEGVPYVQGYVPNDHCTFRVRIAGEVGYLTIKGPRVGISRSEFEYPIPLDDARALLEECCASVVEKKRYIISYEGFDWEVDEFSGANAGLVLAEVELDSAEQQPPLPSWVGTDVSEDDDWSNYSLSINPRPVNH